MGDMMRFSKRRFNTALFLLSVKIKFRKRISGRLVVQAEDGDFAECLATRSKQ